MQGIAPGATWKDRMRKITMSSRSVFFLRKTNCLTGHFLFTQVHSFIYHLIGPITEYVTSGSQVGQDRIRVLGLPQLTLHQRYLLIFAAGRDKWMFLFDAFRIDAQQIISIPEVLDVLRISISFLIEILSSSRPGRHLTLVGTSYTVHIPEDDPANVTRPGFAPAWHAPVQTRPR